MAAAIPIAAAVVGGAVASRGSKKAAATQAEAARDSSTMSQEVAREQMALQREQFDRQERLQREQMARDRQIYDEAIARNEPGRQAGLRGLGQYENQINQGFQYDPRAFDTDRIMNDPGMKFRQETGENALRRQLNAGNGVYSGAAAKALLGFNSNLASQEYGAAYGRAADGEARRKDAYQLRSNQLANLAGIGQTANSASQVAGQAYGQAGQNSTAALGQAGSNMVNASGNALGNMGSAINNNIIGMGNVHAGNSMYQGSTWANVINGAGSALGRKLDSGSTSRGALTGGWFGRDQFGLGGNGGSGD